jgi:hypothetical protein
MDIDQLFENIFDEEVPANSTANVAGAGSDVTVVVTPSAAKKYKKKNKQSLKGFKDSIKV